VLIQTGHSREDAAFAWLTRYFLQLFPAVFGVAMGWLSARLGYVKRDQAQAFGAFVMRFALPFPMLAGIHHMSVSEMPSPGYTLSMLAGFVGTYVIAVLLGRSIFRNDLASSALEGLVCAFPSMAFAGVPILTSVVGSRGVVPILVGNLVTSFVLIPVTLILVDLGMKSNTGAESGLLELLHKSIVHSVKATGAVVASTLLSIVTIAATIVMTS
jgi:malonate transporter